MTDGLPEQVPSGAFLEALLTTSGDGVIGLDRDGIILSWSEGAETIYGYKAGEIIGKSVLRLVPDERHGEKEEILKKLRDGQSVHGHETVRLQKDGAHIPVLLSASPIRDERGEVVATVMVVRDITATKQLERFRLVVEAAPNGMVMVDSDGRIVLVNSHTERLFGYTRDELVGSPVEVLVPERFREGHPQFRQDFFKSPSAREMGAGRELYGLKKDGTEVPVEIGLNPLSTDAGVYVLASIIDITERQHAEERFRLVVEAAPNGMVMVDREGKIVLVNSQTEKLFGYDREELIGQPIETLVPERFRATHPQYRDDFFADPRARAMGAGRELYGLKKDGTEVPVEIGLNPLSQAGGTFVLASIIDITERRRAEDLARDRDEAVALSELKSAFVANISHELRTPLSGIIGMNELLLSTGLSAEQKELAENLRQSAESLLSIVNDLLDLSKIEAGKFVLSMAPVSVISIAQESVKVVSDSARRKRLRLITQFDYSVPDLLLGDPDRIKQVLLNLLSNAVKFTDAGQVMVSATVDSQDAGTVIVRFTVSDTGIGIADEDQKALFKPFSQLDAGKVAAGTGTGLGLSICKSLVELMGGEIGVESSPGEGASFSFTVPLRRITTEPLRPAAEPQAPPRAGRSLQGFLVLVAEDNPLLQSLAVKQLQSLGVEPQAVSTGQAAVEAAQEVPYNLILMDCHMPDVDGLEATKLIRKHEQAQGRRRTPIIAMTAAAMKGDLERCLSAGMDDYLSKPVTMERLQEKLEKWLLIEELDEL